MSLEQELARNTAAMIALTAALSHRFSEVTPLTVADIDRLVGHSLPVVHTSAPVVTGAEWAALQEKEVPKPVAASSAPAATPDTPTAIATLVGGASMKSGTTAVSGTPTATLTIEYAQVAKAITDVFKVDRAKVVAVLAKFGAAKGPQLKAEDYSAFLMELGA